jgi:hypothetical protein
VENPDKDEVQALPALGSTCGRRGPYPTVLGRPAPDTQAYFSLGPVSRGLHRALKQHAAAVRASSTNGFALVGSASPDPGHSLLTRERRPARDGGSGGLVWGH